MFDVLIYLFETYLNNEVEICVDQDTLTDDLTDAGFHRIDVFNALNWLEQLAGYQDELVSPILMTNDPLSMRIYTKEETQRLDADCRGFILFLEQIQVLNIKTREIVIERIMALDISEFNLTDLKWVLLMVLFNTPGYEKIYHQIEEILFDLNEEILH